jgi:molecular chaperone GrpE (heat shock protein)
MSDAATPVQPGDTAGASEPAALSPERIEQALADFRSWLEEFAQPIEVCEPPLEPVDLHTLAGNLIALRQEVNLSTRATRATLEQNADALSHLGELARRSHRAPESAEGTADEAAKPLLMALIDVYDALALARRQVERLRELIGPSSDCLLEAARFEEPPPLPTAASGDRIDRGFFGRLFGAFLPIAYEGNADQALAEWRASIISKFRAREQKTRQAVDYITQTLESLLAGYAMGLERIARVLSRFEVEAIAAEGRRFDPEEMEVLEIVTGATQAEGNVVEEVRRGYRCRGRVLRCAQVRVAR